MALACAHDVRSNAEVVPRINTKQHVNNYSFAQNAEENIKKHEPAQVKAASEAKSLAKRMGGILLREFIKLLNQKCIRSTAFTPKDARRGELTHGK